MKLSGRVPYATALLGLAVSSPIPRIPGGSRGGWAGVDNWSLRSQPLAMARHSGGSAASRERTLTVRTTLLVNQGAAGEAAVCPLRPTD